MKVKDLRGINGALYQRGVAWMPVTYDEGSVTVGPLVAPGRATCYECLLLRVYERHNGAGDSDPDDTARCVNRRAPGKDLYPQLSSLCLNAADRVLGKRRLSRRYQPRYTAYADGRTSEARVVAHPLCSICAGKIKHRRLVLRSRKNIYSAGGFRSVSAEITIKRSRHLIGELGPILELQDQSFCGLSIFGAVGAFPANILKRNRCPYLLRYTGKGSSQVQSAVSAVAEAIERTCAGFAESMVDFTGTRNQLGDKAVDIRELAFNISEINKDYNEQVVNWTRAWSLTDGSPLFIPTEFASLPSYPINGAVTLVPQHTTNGFAAGNNLEEAILQALLEVIERHNMWLAKHVGELVKRICLSDVQIPGLQKIIASAQAEGMETSLYLISSDIEIPTVAALLRSRAEGLPAYSVGFGCHLDPQIAIERALTEAVQMLSMQREIMVNDSELMQQITSYKGRVEDLSEDDVFYYSLEPSIGARFFRTYLECIDHANLKSIRRFVSRDIKQNIQYIVDYLKQAGCEVYVADRSAWNYYFRVVKVIVTTLQPPSNIVQSHRLRKYFER